MDFARPSKFSKEQLRALHLIHEAFCRRVSTHLSGTMRTLVELTVAEVAETPYGEFAAALPTPGFASVLEVAPLGTNAMLTVDLPIMFAMIERMLGGQMITAAPSRELTEIERALASTLMEGMLAVLTDAWSELIDIELRLRGIEENAQLAQIVRGNEPSAVVTMHVTLGTLKGAVSMCVPYSSIESVIDGLAAHRYLASGGEDLASRGSLQESLQSVDVDVRAQIAPARVAMQSILDLQPGDVLELGRGIDEDVQVLVGSTVAYNASMQRSGKSVIMHATSKYTQGANDQ